MNASNMAPRRAAHVLIGLLFLSGAGTPAAAQWTGAAYDPFNPVVGGVPVYCTSFHGQRVAFVPNWNLQDVGRAVPGSPPRIELNPNVLAQLTPRMQLFWYGHECAHHALGPANSEVNADCLSIRTLRNLGVLARREIGELQAQIVGTPGSAWGHLPGPLRAQHFAACYDTS